MSLGNTTENDIVKFIFNDTAMPDYGTGSLWVSLHTADPGESGAQNASEADYGSYARVEVTRDTDGWTVSANQAVNAEDIVFPQASSGTNNITHAALGVASSGATQIIASGALQTPINVVTNYEPIFEAGTLVFGLD